MERDVKNAEKQVAMERLQAFALFHKDGMKAVEQSYPEHMQFVIDHKSKTYREVKRELFSVYEQC
jgi:hypothetical protein